ncbi:MAG TPA: UTP--glucose-1-phosphate uridylyltransferase GalU [Thermoanaerobaculia bacterium]|nr:UTP--glucose-1-phosphate uridylyltransferase GalU [Thermoanaerobaculia bacterium]
MQPLITCVLPCAGYGTRFLPATKVIPKEMLPLVDKPVIQYGVEEALASGLGRIVIVTSRGKESIIDHFDRAAELEQLLEQKQKRELYDEIVRIARMADVIAVRQKEIRGLGDAVAAARAAVGAAPFAVSLPDDVILSDPPALRQMADVFAEKQRPVVALMKVTPDETSRYGMIAGERERDDLFRLTDMVEKPKSNPPSQYAIIGRYILTPEIFDLIGTTGEGAGGEIQLTDALRRMMETGAVYGYVFQGTRYDAGEKLGYLKANVEYGLRDPRFGAEFREYLQSLVQ